MFSFRNIGNTHVLADHADTTYAAEGRPQRQLTVFKGQTFDCPADVRKQYPGKFELIGETQAAEDPFAAWKPDDLPASAPADTDTQTVTFTDVGGVPANLDLGPGESMAEQK